MADAMRPGRSQHRPRIDVVLRGLEKWTRRYDRVLVTGMWLVVASLVFILLTSSIIRHPVVSMRNNWTQGSLHAFPANASRARRRLLHRVAAAMMSTCEPGDIIFGPQALVDGEPYMYQIAYMCDQKILLNSPEVIVDGGKYVECMDEHQGISKVKARSYPLTVNTGTDTTYTFVTPDEACPVSHILDLLAGTW